MKEDKKEELHPEDIECRTFLQNEAENTGSDTTSAPEEDAWESQLEYLLALIGYTVGISAIWRFPIVCARNGGGAFLIPFVILMGLIGAPLYYLEICLGQFCGKGPWRSYEFCPLFKGVGLLMVTMSGLVLWYYQTIMAWIIYYLYSSFSSTLAWTSCDNWWNTNQCQEFTTTTQSQNQSQGITLALSGNTSTGSYVTLSTIAFNTLSSVNRSSTSPASEFWFHNVLRQSPYLEDLGSIQPHLLVCLIISWVLVNICLVRGVKSIGKVVYVTALFPYVLLTILMIRGVTLDGAADGILFYITPKFEKLLEIQVWLDAALQVFYSLGPMWGGIITMAAFNKFNKPVLRDSIIVCSMDLFTALYAGFAVFSVVGFMSKTSGIPIEEMAISSGHGLAFIVYPTAASLLPSPQLWSALFFLSMLLVILDSIFTMAEVTFLCLIEFIPRRIGERRFLVNLAFSAVYLISGFVFITKGGIYLFHIFDWYLSSFALLVGAAFESFMIGNIYENSYVIGPHQNHLNETILMGTNSIGFRAGIKKLRCQYPSLSRPLSEEYTSFSNNIDDIQFEYLCTGADRFSRDIEAMTGKQMSRVTRIIICIVIPAFSVVIFLITVSGLTTPTHSDGTPYPAVFIWIAIILGLVPLVIMFGVGVMEVTTAEGSIKQRLKAKLSPSKQWAPKDASTACIYKTNPYRYESTLRRRYHRNIWGSKFTPYI